MIILWFFAVISVSLSVGTWLGFRLSEESHRIEEETARFVVSPRDSGFGEWKTYR